MMVDLGEEKEIGGIFLYVNFGHDTQWIYDRAIGMYVEIWDASQNVVITTASIQDGRKGYVLDFGGGFTVPSDTNVWLGLDQPTAGYELEEWKQFVSMPCTCCQAKMKKIGLETGLDCVVQAE